MYEPRYYQREAIDSIFEYLNNNPNKNPIVALPTGTGKSIVFAKFAQEALQMYPNLKIMMLTHVKELITQNYEKLLTIWPNSPVGIFSAGVGKKQTSQSIICGGIQSVVKALTKDPKSFGKRNIVLVDECHLISPKDSTSYQKAFDALKSINPHLRVVGLTATPYRMKTGSLVDSDGIFDDICYDMCSVEKFNRLIEEGYLAPLIPKRPETMIDTTGVKTTAGDFNKKQLSEAVDKEEITYQICREIVNAGYERKSWLIFATSIEHAEHLSETLQSFGIDSTVTHSKLPKDENDERIVAFKNGQYRALVNNNKLTTGFDHPGIDLIAVVRPTKSCGLWVQMLGRGTRPSPGKENCIVLDFAGNTERLGPINDPLIPEGRKGSGTPGDAPIKICPECNTYCHAVARFCPECQHEFVRENKLNTEASNLELIKKTETSAEVEKKEDFVKELTVSQIYYNVHEKPGSAYPTMKVTYVCGINRIREWVCFSHPSRTVPSIKAKQWWKLRCPKYPPPPSVHMAVEYLSKPTAEVKVPKTIKVKTKDKYPEVVGITF